MTASNDSSFPSEGRAIFTAEPIKGKINDAIVATRSTTPLLLLFPTGLFIISQFNLFTGNLSRGGRHSLSNCFLLLKSLPIPSIKGRGIKVEGLVNNSLYDSCLSRNIVVNF